jgi:hypothetical protein
MDPAPPLAAYGVYLDGPAEDPAIRAARAQIHDAVEAAIAACMASQGFPYIPVPYSTSFEDLTASRRQLSTGLRYLPVPRLPADREAVIREGYGIMAAFDEQMAAPGWTDEDPNATYLAALSPAEFEAYQAALFGDLDDPSTGVSSCSGQATAQFSATPAPGRKEAFATEFGDLVDAARTSVLTTMTDPRTVALDAEWEACMTRQGYTFEEYQGDHDPSVAMAVALRTRPDGTLGPTSDGEASADIPVEEKSLLGTEPERKVALADYDCRVETDYLDRLTQVRWSLDEQFIEEHQGELDRLVAAAETGS